MPSNFSKLTAGTVVLKILYSVFQNFFMVLLLNYESELPNKE